MMSKITENGLADPKHDSDGDITEEEGHNSTRKYESSLSLSGNLSCGICLNVLRHPYTIIPCLHTFDKLCLSQWWKNQPSCPVCKERSKSARFAFQLSGIIEYHHQVKKRKITKEEPIEEEAFSPGTTEEIFPNGHDQSDFDDTDTDSDAESGSSQLPAITPVHNGVLWPCISCIPGNFTGYTCPTPIPQPLAAEAAATGAILQPPPRGDARPALVDPVTRQFCSLAAKQHRHCDSCTTYLPASGLPVQCRICKIYTCCEIDPNGCPRSTPQNVWDPIMLIALRDVNLQMRHAQITNFTQLWNWCEYPLASNTHEQTRFMSYMSSGTRTPNEVHTEFEESVKRWLTQQSRAPPRRQRDSDNTETDTINTIADRLARESQPDEQHGGSADVSAPGVDTDTDTDTAVGEQGEPNWRVCFQCLMTTARSHFYRWWSNERATGSLDPLIAGLGHCWYGRECRTQVHNSDHAFRYNHVCENTSVARGRAPAQGLAAT